MHCAHLRDERIALGHVTDKRLDLLCFVGDVVAEDLSSARGGLMKPEQRVDQCRLAGTVWTEQTNRFAAQIAAQVFENLPAAKRDAETMKVDHRWLDKSHLRFDGFLPNRSGECHTVLISLCPDNSKRIRVRRPCP